MGTPIKLVPQPSAAEERKAQVLEILRARLAAAERGEIEEVIVICKRVDGCWKHHETGSHNFVETIGRLEILKADMTARYLVTNDRS